MPSAAPHVCPSAGCAEMVPRGQRACPTHTSERHAQTERWRGTRQERGYDNQWLKVRKQALLRDCGLCQPCLRAGKLTQVGTSGQVDHKISIEQRPDLRLNLANLQTICNACHSRKTRQQSERYGRLVVIWGPPCAGKSTLAEQLAAAESGVVVDWDKIVARMSGKRLHDYSGVHQFTDAANESYRITIESLLKSGTKVFAVITQPQRLFLAYPACTDICVDPGIQECMSRARKRPDPESTRRGIEKWYESRTSLFAPVAGRQHNGGNASAMGTVVAVSAGAHVRDAGLALAGRGEW